MATLSTATTRWAGSLMEGKGTTEMTTSGIGTFDVAWSKRAESGTGMTNPEELLAASLATCFTMALSHMLSEEGNAPTSIETKVDIAFVPGTGVTGATITVAGEVPGLDAEGFKAKAEAASQGCPISQALANVPKELIVK